jgi:pyruvate/2-oxoglutarate dehydrogenase complex dihydrolipoamide dehydrogenase (E3) component
MKKYTHDVIVIGGGSGGLTATSGFAQLGLKTLLIESDRLGGDCLYYGCVPSKTLITSARVYRLVRQSNAYGLPEFTSSIPDAARVMAHVKDVINGIAPHDSPERFRGLGAEVIFGSPRFISPHELMLEGKIVSAANIIISTGSEPLIPAIPGLAETDYITNKTVFSLKSFPSSLAVIGGGPIGSELSQALSRFGVKVSMFEASPHILAKDDADAAGIVESALRKEGVDIRTGTKVEKIEPQGRGQRLFFGEGESIEADAVLVAAGRKGNIDGLDLEKAGVETERGFIRTDSHLSTSQKHILAIGDCNGKYMFTHTAGAEGSLAIRKIAFHLPVTMDYSNIPWCTYTDPEIASLGYN